jgi:hypothetical protein
MGLDDYACASISIHLYSDLQLHDEEVLQLLGRQDMAEACDLPYGFNQGMPVRACHPAGELLFHGTVRYLIGEPSAGCYT